MKVITIYDYHDGLLNGFLLEDSSKLSILRFLATDDEWNTRLFEVVEVQADLPFAKSVVDYMANEPIIANWFGQIAFTRVLDDQLNLEALECFFRAHKLGATMAIDLMRDRYWYRPITAAELFLHRSNYELAATDNGITDEELLTIFGITPAHELVANS